MKRIKGKVFLSIILLMGTFISASAYSYSSYFGGKSGSDISWNWWTGWNVQGDYTEAVAANRAGHPAYMKRAYARSGATGVYSDWMYSGDYEARAKDYGPYGTTDCAAYGYWDYDQ